MKVAWLFSGCLVFLGSHLFSLQAQGIHPQDLCATLYGYDGQPVATSLHVSEENGCILIRGMLESEPRTWVFGTISKRGKVYFQDWEYGMLEFTVSRNRITTLFYTNDYYTITYGLAVDYTKTRRWE